MSEVSSPPAARLRSPSWLDARLVLGILLVLVSVVVGSRVLAGADRSDRVYAATRDLAPGTALTDSDLRVVPIRLFGAGSRYVSAAGPKPLGWVVARQLGADEIVPRQALAPAPLRDVRLVTVPVASHHFPAGLGHGDLVDVYASVKARAGLGAGQAAPAPSLVLSAVPVDSVYDAAGGRLSGTADAGIVLRVPTADVARVVGAAAGAAVDLVRLPSGSPGGSAGALGSSARTMP